MTDAGVHFCLLDVGLHICWALFEIYSSETVSVCTTVGEDGCDEHNAL